MSGIFIPTLRAFPSPRVSLLFASISKHLVGESLHGPEPCPRSADSRSTTFIKGLAARELALETAGFLVSRESGARAIRPPRPCLCLVRLVAEIFDICFVVCRYAGSPCPRIARASRIATIKSWEFFPTTSRFKVKELLPYRVITPPSHRRT